MQLLADVKNFLDITWDDPEGDKKLAGIITRGKQYMNRLAGKELDYSTESKARELLFEYCRYARDNALNEFQINYEHELVAFSLDYAVGMTSWGGTEGDGGNEGGGTVDAKLVFVFYLPDNNIGGFDETGSQINYVGGAVRYYAPGAPEVSGVVTVPSGSFPYVHGQFILLDTVTAQISIGAWPEDDGSKKACGYMHTNGQYVGGEYRRVHVAELFGMGTQVWAG